MILRQANQTRVIIFCLLFVAGCPNTTPTDPRIDEVQPEPNASQRDFRLRVVGRGFGLKSVQFDLSKREGVVATATLSVQIEQDDNVIKRIDRVDVESPQLLYAQVALAEPLPTGLYDVTLFEGVTELASKQDAFFVPPATSTNTPDAGMPDAIVKDAAPIDGDVPPDEDAGMDAGEPDADAPDIGPPDTGVVDSGLGPFQGAYAHRRLVIPNHSVAAPARVTIEIPIPHATMLADGSASNADGSDLAIYQGPDRLEHQWRDRFVLQTDALVLVARLVRDLPIGGSETDPLVLYSGDANAALDVSDDVFEFAERFVAPVDGTWQQANAWGHCNLDRPEEINTAVNGAYCAVDASTANLSRSTLATPTIGAISDAPGANLTYEMSIWMAGRTIDGPADILYFSYGAVNNQFDNTIEPDLSAYAGFVPNGTLTFLDTDNQDRTVNGWRYPLDVVQWWQRMILRFVPAIDGPALHFRYVSSNPAASASSFSAIDDWTVRLALDPDFAPALGPVEDR